MPQSRAGLNEVIPGRLYQRGRFMSWSRKMKDQVLDERGIGMVVNLWSKVDPEVSNDSHRTYLHFPVRSDHPPSSEMLDALLSFIILHLNEGVAVLIHCEAGVNRSCFLAACLVAEFEGRPGEEALAWIEQTCGRVKLNRHLKRFVLDHYPFETVGAKE